LKPGATLADVAFAVCSALDRIGERALLVGGSAATYYAPESYQSHDCDFILTFGSNTENVLNALAAIGFERAREGYFRHAEIPFTVEFPLGPAFIGNDLIERYSTIRRDTEVLHIYTPTDVVRDRFMHFWAWGDFSALRVALDVASAQRENIDYEAIVTWTERELAEAPGAYDLVRRDLFLKELQTTLTGNPEGE
jgi:hypothetical protein